jgi:hypothetical protein
MIKECQEDTMIDQIGEIAGKVWMFLKQNGESNLNQLKKGIKADPNLILQAIGWLAREDKILIEKKGRFVTYALKD